MLPSGNPEITAQRWNDRHPVGVPVIAYTGARPEIVPSCRQIGTRTRSEAVVRGGTAVAWVEGHGAWIALTHLDVIDPDRPPSGCRHCALPKGNHGRRWNKAAGWHPWVMPTDTQIKARMHARRAARMPRPAPAS